MVVYYIVFTISTHKRKLPITNIILLLALNLVFKLIILSKSYLGILARFVDVKIVKLQISKTNTLQTD